MIELSIIAPAPLLLGLSDSSDSKELQLPFSEQLTVGEVFEMLAASNPPFERLLHGSSNELIAGLMVSVDGKMLLRKEDRQIPLQDGCKIVLLTPYSGG